MVRVHCELLVTDLYVRQNTINFLNKYRQTDKHMHAYMYMHTHKYNISINTAQLRTYISTHAHTQTCTHAHINYMQLQCMQPTYHNSLHFS